MSWQDLKVEKVYEGKNVRHWRVTRGKAGQMVTVRESALSPMVYLCLTCISLECDHTVAVKDFDRADGATAVTGVEA